jgi:hypothetical protein
MALVMDTVPETATNTEVVMDPQVVSRRWETIASMPDTLTDMSEHNVFYIAGGGLPTLFGKENQLWSRMQAKLAEQNDELMIAGVPFNGEELGLIGEYARAMEAEGKLPECIDERLDESLENPNDKHVHVGCGAAGAAGAAIGEGSVEDELVSIFGESGKMPIYADMDKHHDSIVINVDLSGSRTAQGELRSSLKDDKALPFNVSLNLDKIGEIGGDKTAQMLSALVKWNVQIARNIIGGGHNAAQKLEDKTIIVINTQGAESELLEQAKQRIEEVPHDKTVVIG